ncbi:MAG: hypothetical protein IPK82_28355 [Polyangiaceae bacterium]|nr:hypothetical protein [Polyangiaceae bacterium]
MRLTLVAFAASAAIWLFGCSKEDERFPPPISTITGLGGGSTTAPPGGSGGSGGTGAGGMTTGGTGGIAPTVNVCNCLVDLWTETPCADCAQTALVTQDQCATEEIDCSISAGCVQVFSTCPSNCVNTLPVDQQAACITDCILPFEDTDAYHRFFDLTNCLCGASCKTLCGNGEPMTCE